MSRRQLAALFTINLALQTMGSVVASLLPIYAAKFGADSALIGFYMSSTAGGIAVGTILAGWLSDRLQRRKMGLIVAGVAEIFGLWLMGQAPNMPQLFVITVAVGVLFGVQLATVNILAGLFAKEGERGRVFGLIASASALGALIGGLAGGSIVDRWGFTGFFAAAAVVTIVQPVAGLLVQDKTLEPVQRAAVSVSTRSPLLSAAFLLLFVASILAFISSSVQGMGRSLLMDKLGFGGADITSTVAISGLITLPFPFLLGWLSDRLGRKPLIMACYLTSTVSLLILAGSFALWHFWVSTALQVIVGASIAIGSALVTDLVPQEALGSGLALFGATFQIGQVVGFAATGIAMQSIGMTPTLIGSAFLALIAIVIVIPIRRLAGKLAEAAG